MHTLNDIDMLSVSYHMYVTTIKIELRTYVYTYIVIFKAEIFTGEAKVKFGRIKFLKIANFEDFN